MKPLLFALCISAFLLGCKKEDDPAIIPDIKISTSTVIISEDTPEGRVWIFVYLSEATKNEVSVKYETVDSTAVSGKNYQAFSGTLDFVPGSKYASVPVAIMHDTADKSDKVFHIQFSDAVNGIINGNELARVKISNVDYSTIIWNDEFDGPTLNTVWWNYEQGNNNGWGNNELQNYTNDIRNVYIDTGYLHITARNPATGSYTSGRITTLNKQQFTYGRIDIRAKMPIGQGIWPALWMLGANISTDGWPKCGEIDIMEYLGHQPDRVHGTVHWDQNGHNYIGSNVTLTSGNFHNSFHVFTLIWTPNRMSWLVDGKQYYERKRSEISSFPFDLPQFLIFNVAVGGNWPGYPDHTTTFPQTMIVDYVRWFR